MYSPTSVTALVYRKVRGSLLAVDERASEACAREWVRERRGFALGPPRHDPGLVGRQPGPVAAKAPVERSVERLPRRRRWRDERVPHCRTSLPNTQNSTDQTLVAVRVPFAQATHGEDPKCTLLYPLPQW